MTILHLLPLLDVSPQAASAFFRLARTGTASSLLRNIRDDALGNKEQSCMLSTEEVRTGESSQGSIAMSRVWHKRVVSPRGAWEHPVDPCYSPRFPLDGPGWGRTFRVVANQGYKVDVFRGSYNNSNLYKVLICNRLN